MWKIALVLLVLASMALAQSSSDGSFSVRHAKNENFSLSKTEMQKAESLYQNACAAVQHEFHSTEELRPHFTVIVGADRDQVHGYGVHAPPEIWMKKWDPTVFAEGVVVLAFDQILSPNLVTQLSKGALNVSNATADGVGFK